MSRFLPHRIAAASGATLLGSLVLLGIAGPAQAADIAVPSGSSINTAIQNAQAGDTLTVADGTYAENIVINKNVTLIAADQGGATINGTIVFSAPATLSGFTVSPPAGTAPAVNVQAGGAGSSIVGNTIEGADQLIVVRLAQATAEAPTTISGNTLRDFSTSGQPSALFISSSSYVTVSGNTIGNTTSVPGSVGVNILNGANHVTVSGNTISNVENAVAALSTGASPVTDITIQGNTVNGTSASAIVLANANLQNVSITGNTVSNVAPGSSTASAVQIGVASQPSPAGSPALDGVVIGSNTVTNAPNGVVLNDGVVLADDDSVTVSDNTFRGLTANAIVVAPTVNGSVSAPDNDFGGAPVVGAVVVPAATEPAAPAPAPAPELAATGIDPMPLVVSAALFAAFGLAIVLMVRRRRVS